MNIGLPVLRLGIYLGVIAAAAIVVSESMNFAFDRAVQHVAEIRSAPKPATLRPSYVATTPDLTSKDLDATRQVPVVAAGKAAEAQMGLAATGEQVAKPRGELFRVRANGLNVRSGPNKDSPKIMVLELGEEVEVAETLRNWVRITTADGRGGWVYSKYLAAVEQD